MTRSKKADGPGCSRERILDAAVDLFSRRGYFGVSIRDITRRVGIKESSLYNHFAGKEALLEAVFDRCERAVLGFHEGTKTKPDMAAAMPVLGLFRRQAERYIDFWSREENLRLWLVVSMEQYRHPRAARLIIQETERIERRALDGFSSLARGQEALQRQKELRPLVRAYIYALRAMQLELALLQRQGLDDAPMRRKIDECISFFVSVLERTLEAR